MYKRLLIITLLTIIKPSDNARILGIIPTPSYSHQVAFQPLWKELSLRGHQVTVLTTDPVNDLTLTNLTEIDISSSYKIFRDRLLEMINSKNVYAILKLFTTTFGEVFQNQVEHPKVQQLMNDPSVKFDLLIVEYISLEPMAFSRRFNCPFIGILYSDAPSRMHKILGNPTHPILYPTYMIGEDGSMSLPKRIISVLYEYIALPYLYSGLVTAQEDLVEKYFGQRYDLTEIQKSVSMLFLNSDPIFHPIRPNNPTVIQVGGKLMRLPSKALPEDLKATLDKASNGFIYFSLGSNVNSKDMHFETMNAILETFNELPYTILWKYETDRLDKKPNNVIISKWFPQLEVLKHPNIKLFISQVGALSMEEAISARVPLLGIPFFADQHYNVKKIVNRGCGLELDYKTFEKTKFKETILELINNPSYRNQISKLADLAEDQPMTGLERAVWWTEYVLRHNGTKHLRSPALDIPWYQYLLLDVIAVLASILLVVVCLCVLALKKTVKIIMFVIRGNMKLKNQ